MNNESFLNFLLFLLSAKKSLKLNDFNFLWFELILFDVVITFLLELILLFLFDEFGLEDILLLFSFISVFKICFILLVTVSIVFLLYLELISIIFFLKESK